MKFSYLILLLISLAGIIALDYRYKLAFFYHPSASIKTIGAGTSLLLVADIIGINWHIFSTNQKYVIGIGLGSENIPIEEILLLAFINYFVICVYRLFVKRTKNV